MIIPDRTTRIGKKLSVTVNTIDLLKVAFPDHIWLPFIYQAQSDEVLFAIILFDLY